MHRYLVINVRIVRNAVMSTIQGNIFENFTYNLVFFKCSCIEYICSHQVILLIVLLSRSCGDIGCYIVEKVLVTLHGIPIDKCYWFDIKCITIDTVGYWVTNNRNSSAASIWRKDGDHIEFKLSAKGDR